MMEGHLVDLAPWAWVPAVLFGIYWACRQYLDHKLPTANVPTVDVSDFETCGQAMMHGYDKYKEGFQIRTGVDTYVVLPMHLYPETDRLGKDTLSLHAEVYRRFLGRWTYIGIDIPALAEAVRKDLTRNIDRIMSAGTLTDETQHALETEIGSSSSWTPVPVYAKLLNCVSRISGRIFVGLPLCREKEWMDISIGYTVNAVRAFEEARIWSPVLRPLVAPFLPGVRRCIVQQRKMREWMRPLIAKEKQARQPPRSAKEVEAGVRRGGGEGGAGAAGLDLDGDRGTFITWLMRHLPESLHTEQELTCGQLLISFASIHTTSSTTAMALFDLACRPELVKLLREEMEQVAEQDQLKKTESGVTIWPKSSIVRLWKLDSFLQESLRVNAGGFATPPRRVLRPITFSNGLHVARNSRLIFPSWAVHFSDKTETFSPSYNAGTGNSPPEEFDALRFYRLRSTGGGRERKHQALTTSCENLSFGHGHHACPGRFFALYEIKIILMTILQQYDIKCQGDEDGTGGVERRPKNINAGLSVIVDPVALVEFRRRHV